MILLDLLTETDRYEANNNYYTRLLFPFSVNPFRGKTQDNDRKLANINQIPYHINTKNGTKYKTRSLRKVVTIGGYVDKQYIKQTQLRSTTERGIA